MPRLLRLQLHRSRWGKLTRIRGTWTFRCTATTLSTSPGSTSSRVGRSPSTAHQSRPLYLRRRQSRGAHPHRQDRGNPWLRLGKPRWWQPGRKPVRRRFVIGSSSGRSQQQGQTFRALQKHKHKSTASSVSPTTTSSTASAFTTRTVFDASPRSMPNCQALERTFRGRSRRSEAPRSRF